MRRSSRLASGAGTRSPRAAGATGDMSFTEDARPAERRAKSRGTVQADRERDVTKRFGAVIDPRRRSWAANTAANPSQPGPRF